MKNEELRMNAYYYSFRRTGVIEIDRILSAVASAGKGYHHTESWAYVGSDGEPSYIDLIQGAADKAAKAWLQSKGEGDSK